MRFIYLIFILSWVQTTFAQAPKKPKLVVGIVVDQMRYDFLYRYYKQYGKGGFRRMLNQGFSFSQCQYSYFPTYTAPGHASIYTGTTPAVHGITGNNWYEPSKHRGMYCVQDDSVNSIGGGRAGLMSPRNMKSWTLGDQIRLSENFISKSFGVSIKDRGAILPAGHAANAAFWFEGESGRFISSTWYRNLQGKLPEWLEAFNRKDLCANWKRDSTWKPILPLSSYAQSTADLQVWEKAPWTKPPVFPYVLKENPAPAGETILTTPFGNTLTERLAEALIEGEKLGQSSQTDFLAVSFSCTDIVGHEFGPFSIETQDTYLRLDRDLERFFRFLDEKVGNGNYLCFLSADHGIMEVPVHMKSQHLPAGNFSSRQARDSLKAFCRKTYGSDALIEHLENQQVFIDQREIDRLKLDRRQVVRELVKASNQLPLVQQAFAWEEGRPFPEPVHLKKMEAGYYRDRCGDIVLLLEPGVMDRSSEKGTTHGAPWVYDSHVPFVLMGWKIKAGKSSEPVDIQDIAPTLSNLLHIMAPNGSTGKAHAIPLEP